MHLSFWQHPRVQDLLPLATSVVFHLCLVTVGLLLYATTKVMLTRELDMSLGSAIEMEALTQALLMRSHDHGEFYAAWSEGRKPAWSGR